MEVGIIGGGMMGLATAFYLGKAGVRTTILEKENRPGGLSGFEEILPDLQWDRFYHVILPTDEHLLQLLKDIGLFSETVFVQTKTGFYTNGEMHSMSSTAEFIGFRPISLWNKLRLGVGILYASMIDNSDHLESLEARTWLTRVFGRANYEKMWEPLLRSKLGDEASRVSASFIWAYIHRLYGTRKNGSKKELLGCVRGGYRSVIARLEEELVASGGRVLVDHTVDAAEELTDGRVRVHCNGGRAYDYDAVISTVPSPEVVRILPHLSADYRAMLGKVRYLKLVCATLLLERPLAPFYVTNITDPGFPFTGLIEASHVIPRSLLGGRGLAYLPRYMSPDDPFYEKSDDEVLDIFLKGLRRIFPGFSADGLIESAVHRELYVQPVQDLGYSAKIPPMQTPVANFYLVNTTMIRNSSLNNNQVVQLAKKAADFLMERAGWTDADTGRLRRYAGEQTASGPDQAGSGGSGCATGLRTEALPLSSPGVGDRDK